MVWSELPDEWYERDSHSLVADYPAMSFVFVSKYQKYKSVELGDQLIPWVHKTPFPFPDEWIVKELNEESSSLS